MQKTRIQTKTKVCANGKDGKMEDKISKIFRPQKRVKMMTL